MVLAFLFAAVNVTAQSAKDEQEIKEKQNCLALLFSALKIV